MSGDITLPPLPHRALRPGAGDDAMQDYARAAVLLDRQRAAPSAEPQSVEAQSAEWLLSQCEEYQRRAHEAEREVVRLRSSTPPDHTALLRQALEALEERYIGALRDNALDALRAALGEKR
jgi:hypothetical protein